MVRFSLMFLLVMAYYLCCYEYSINHHKNSFFLVDAFLVSKTTTTKTITTLHQPSPLPPTTVVPPSSSSSPQRRRNTILLFYGGGDPLPEEEDITFPHPDLKPVDVANMCMTALQCRPAKQSLEICFNFSSDRCRAAVGGSLNEFIQYASNPIFGTLVNCASFEILSIGPIIPGGPHRGAMQTVLYQVVQEPSSSTSSSTAGGGVTTTTTTTSTSTDGEDNDNNNKEFRRVIEKVQHKKRRPSALERRQMRERKERGEPEELPLPTTTTKGGEVLQDGTRKFLWTFQQERRPPRQNCWLVHEVLFVQNAVDLTM